ncbi:MAG: hypothetical protein AB7O73_04075 [Bacteroidia bacterium]
MKKILLLILFIVPVLFGLTSVKEEHEKIKGVNFVSPVKKIYSNCITPVKRINANWIALCPFAFMSPGNPKVEYDINKNWWGDCPEGICKLTECSKTCRQKILLKPHFWVDQQGWPGDYDLDNKNWLIWENNYRKFMLKLAHVADSMNIEMLSIGAEFKTATQKRPQFWSNLIDTLRKVYKGKLTYAANWDEYNTITFWHKLDYIGVDAYFPLINTETPGVDELQKEWKKVIVSLEGISKKYNKKILFTEYGYRSINNCAWRQWEIENVAVDKNINLAGQQNAYEALYNAVWNKEWFAGGFLWKWFDKDTEAGGIKNSDYTPQNKPAEKIIQKWYSTK